MAKAEGLTCKVWTEAELKKRGFGGILGVGQGSVNPPRLIELTYKGAGGVGPDRPHREGRLVRLGRAVDQGREGHGDDEDRHGRGRVDPRDDEGDRSAEAEDQRHRGDPLAPRTCPAARRRSPAT